MAIIKQYRGEPDDSPFDVPAWNDFISPVYSGLIPPRLWIMNSGAGDAKWWTIPVTSNIAFRTYFQLRNPNLAQSSRLVRFRPTNEVYININANLSLSVFQSAARDTSPVMPVGEELRVEIILAPASFVWAIFRGNGVIPLYSGQGTFPSVPSITLVTLRHISGSDIYLDNVQLNDDVSRFIGPERLTDKQEGEPLRDWELVYDCR